MSTRRPKHPSLKIVGYADRLSVQPGQTVRFMVSTKEPKYSAELVRLYHGDVNPRGPGFKEKSVKKIGDFRGREQGFERGSFVRVKNGPALKKLRSFTLQAWIYPTLIDDGSHGIITQWSEAGKGAGYGLFLEEGRISLRLRNTEEDSDELVALKRLAPFNWYFVSGTYDHRSGRATIRQRAVEDCGYSESDDSSESKFAPGAMGSNSSDLMIAAYDSGDRKSRLGAAGLFNGKIDGPRVFGKALSGGELDRLAVDGVPPKPDLVAAWDFSSNTQSTAIRDSTKSHLDGVSFNFPVRAVTGHNWTGQSLSFREVPGEYNAIHFHDNSLGDAGWKADFKLTIPDGTKSGVYAAKLTTAGGEDYVPFFVRPKKGKPTAKIAFLMPTMTYIAYGSEHHIGDPVLLDSLGITDFDYPKQPQDVYGVENDLLSLYDRYSDRWGVCYASRLKPIVNMRPKYLFPPLVVPSEGGDGSPARFNADLFLVDWLTAKGIEFDVITDEDLHTEGRSLLAPYRVVLSGHHPEYWTDAMVDGLESYLNGGGRMMYLGGNGVYWNIAINPEHSHMFEVRRWWGWGSWMSHPGEFYNSFTGTLGGTWRNKGRAPQKLLGVGYTAGGCDYGMPYKRGPGSFDERVSFIFEGVGKDEPIGDFPSLILGRGAAGFELDRVDYELGTPRHALVLATATGFTDVYQHTLEEMTLTDNRQGGTVNPLVKADMVYLTYPKGGGVFSVGSVTWCGSLSYNNYDNNVSKITANVLKRFAESEPLP